LLDLISLPRLVDEKKDGGVDEFEETLADDEFAKVTEMD